MRFTGWRFVLAVVVSVSVLGCGGGSKSGGAGGTSGGSGAGAAGGTIGGTTDAGTIVVVDANNGGNGGVDAPVETPDADLMMMADAKTGDAPAAKLTIGGTVNGLGGPGLVLQNNLGDDLSISANGTFSFSTAVNPGSAYSITVRNLPTAPAQTCVVTNGTGNALVNVTNVMVTCTTTSFSLGGTISGLSGTGLVLQNGGGETLSVASNGVFTFPTKVASGSMFNVSVKTQPSTPTQACVVSGGSGIVGADKVTSVVVNCANNAFVVGGTISGLAGTLVLQNNGGNDLSLTTNGSFAFSEPLTGGSAYSVTIKTQPSVPSQTCTVSAGSGNVAAANVTGVSVVCTTNKFSVGGTVSGLNGSVVLRNGTEILLLVDNGAFTFTKSVESGATYAVLVQNQPSSTQTCIVTNGAATVGSAKVTNVSVTCDTNTYSVGGSVLGLNGTNLVLRNNGGDPITINANGGFTFPTAVNSGTAFNVSIATQPTAPAQTCNISGGMGTVGTANVSGVVVNCATNSYTIGGSISGLIGSVVLRNNATDSLVVSANGSFAFSQPVASGTNFNVTVLTQPTNPTQTCVVSSGGGTTGTSNVTNVNVVCSTSAFRVGGVLSGLAFGGTVVLTNNAADSYSLNTNGIFAFPAEISSGGSYSVAVLTQPTSPAQVCTVTNGTGTIAGAHVTNLLIACTTNDFSVGGTVSGVSGLGLVLQNNNGDDLAVGSNGAFMFPSKVPSGGSYKVTVKTQPSSPVQSCSVTGDSGTVGASAVTSVQVNCSTNTFTVSGTINGLTGSGLVLQNNGGSNLSVSSGSFAFPPAPSGSIYSVTVLTQPSSPTQTCVVSSGGVGTLDASNVANVIVSCTTNTYSVGGSISGLLGTGLVLQNNLGSNLPVAGSPFAFANVASGSGYSVTVLTQPSNPTQTCMVASGATGTVAGANVSNVSITCSTNIYSVGGTVSGLSMGESVLLQNNNGNNTTVSANGNFSFSNQLMSGSPYNVTIASQPAGMLRTCSVTSPTGVVGGADVSVPVTCVNTCGTGQVICSGSCTNTTYDPSNCGGCGTMCSYSNAAAACSASACVMGACSAGFADCDRSSVNGCEVGTTNSVVNCGGCGIACPLGETCSNSVCSTTAYTSNFLGYWNFDEASGTTAADSSGHNLTGNLVGTATFTPGAGKGGTGAITFNGGYVDVKFPNSAANQGTGLFMPQGNVTYSMWVKTSNAVVQGLQVIWGSTWGGGWDRVIGNGSGGKLSYNAWNEVNFDGNATINDNNWHHVVYVLDKSAGLFAYVDGVLDASSTSPTSNCGLGCSGFNWASDYIIGTGNNGRFGANAFIGLIDDVRVYSVPLSASTVAALYNATK